MKGKVKWFNGMKRFGFIEGDDGKDYFVHQTEIKDGNALQDNEPVNFEVEQGDKGPKAVNVTRGTETAGEKSEDTEESEDKEEEPETEQEDQENE